jgi:hypothetical protein
VSHASHCSAVRKITGIALLCTGPTTEFGAVVRKPYSRCLPSSGAFRVPRVPVQSHQMPAKANSGRSPVIANHVQTFLPVTGSAVSVGSQKAGNRHKAAKLRLHPGAPMRRVGVPDVGHAAVDRAGLEECRRCRHSPSGSDDLALSGGPAADNRCLFVGEDTGQAELVPTARVEKLAHRLVGGRRSASGSVRRSLGSGEGGVDST